MKRYKGGCAVMLKLWDREHPCDLCALSHPAMEWTEGHDEWKSVDMEDYHLTLQFIGRDLAGPDAAMVITSAFGFAEESGPIEISFTGRFSVHATSKGRYLVAEVQRSDALEASRKRLLEILRLADITPKDPFPFRPHVTLAEAPPTARDPGKLPTIAPFSVEYRELVVKYGPHRMIVEL